MVKFLNFKYGLKDSFKLPFYFQERLDKFLSGRSGLLALNVNEKGLILHYKHTNSTINLHFVILK